MSDKITIAITFFLLLFTNAAYALEPTLCKNKEITLFSCAAKNKIISVCSSKELSLEKGFVTYRFGKSKDIIELEYSSTAKNFSNKFKFASNSYPKGGTAELSFKIGKYTYTVYSGSHVYRHNFFGVAIERNSKTTKYINCDKLNQNYRPSLFHIKYAGHENHKLRGLGRSQP